jgi:hypothetical protein
VQPQVRTLNEICEQAGWRVRDNTGKTVMPNISTILDLMMFDNDVDKWNGQFNHTPDDKRIPPDPNNKFPKRWVDVVTDSPRAEQEDVSWPEIKVTVDSGACDHVISPELVNTDRVRVTDSVRNGLTYRTASRHVLPNLGETTVAGVTGTGHPINMTMQVAGVNKALASVRKMCKAGNRVVFEDGGNEQVGGYVQDIESGERVPIFKEGGTYQVSVWIREQVRAGTPSYFDALVGFDKDDEVPNSGS